jgi:hypothetical protein
MVKTEFKSVDEYIASQPEAVQGVLECVRAFARKISEIQTKSPRAFFCAVPRISTWRSRDN